jgi:hypothetical protein
VLYALLATFACREPLRVEVGIVTFVFRIWNSKEMQSTTQIEANNLWELDRVVERAMDSLRVQPVRRRLVLLGNQTLLETKTKSLADEQKRKQTPVGQ